MVRSGTVVLVLAVGLVLATCSKGGQAEDDGYRGETITNSEPPQHTTTPPTRLGIYFRACPEAEPEELSPNALVGATAVALDQAPSVFGDVRTTEDVYALVAYRIKGGVGPFGPRPGIVRDMCRAQPQHGKRLLERGVEVDVIFPMLQPRDR